LEKIKHGFKTLAECGGIRGVDDTSSFYVRYLWQHFTFSSIFFFFLPYDPASWLCHDLLGLRANNSTGSEFAWDEIP
jgi:hypothetical protein